MTNDEIDVLMRRILIDAIKAEEAEHSKDHITFSPSIKYLRQINAMLKNPLRWTRKSALNRLLKAVAMLVLVLSMSSISIFMISPVSRATFVHWLQEVYQTIIIFRFNDEVNINKYDFSISELPEGFVEVMRTKNDQTSLTIYEDDDGNSICLEYIAMDKGTVSWFSTSDADVTEIMINDYTGYFLNSTESTGTNTLIWNDTEHHLQFTIDSTFGLLDMFHMALSVYE